MVRIDEIYHSTFWPFIKRRIPLTRMMYCDPADDPQHEHLANYGNHIQDFNYVFFHDHVPVHLDLHKELFDNLVERTGDLNDTYGPIFKAIVTSEHSSESVRKLCHAYKWKSYYYFFHGWAALDWYRGYKHTFLIKPPVERTITKGMLLTEAQLDKKQITAFTKAEQSFAYSINETIQTGNRHYLTEKTFRPICLSMPFVLLSTAGSLEYLRSYGFKTFSTIFDESYDLEVDDTVRAEMVSNLQTKLNNLPADKLQSMYESALPIIQHNHDHFYDGNFRKILWDEVTGMLNKLSTDFEIC